MPDLTTVNESVGKLRAIESELSTLFIEREEVVRAMLIALLSREHLAFRKDINLSS
jgi:MoxR-like ATPase